MSLAKQIGSVAKTALTNAGHMNMNNEIYARILDTTVAALHLEALAPGYKECIDREAECVNRVTKSASTAQLEAKDKERDKTLQFIYSMNGSYKVCPRRDPAYPRPAGRQRAAGLRQDLRQGLRRGDRPDRWPAARPRQG